MASPAQNPILRFLQRYGTVFLPLMGNEQTTLLLVGSFVGILLAFGATAFGVMVDFVSRLTFGSEQGRFSLEPQEEILQPLLHTPIWWVVLAPAIGGLLVGPLVQRFAREAKGHGIPEVMEAVALRGGRIRKRVAAVKVIASALTIGSGGSAGREGPVVQIGASIASGLSKALGFKAVRTKTLVGCGAAAGIAATFNAPIAGVVFSLEIITGSFALAAFTPVVAAAVMATVVTHYLRGNVMVFEIPGELQAATALSHPFEIIPHLGLGLLAGLASVLYIRMLYATEDRFDRFKVIPVWARAAVGGLGVGLLGILLPRVMGQGYDTILASLADKPLPLFDRFPDTGSELSPALVTALAFLVLGFAKMFATSLTIGSGGSGGVFAPSLFIGACLGGAFGIAVNQVFPDTTAIPAGYALVGMAAVVAGVTHAPISAALILFEMTDDYNVILPVMLATVISTAVCNHTLKDSIYTLKLRRHGVRLHAGHEQTVLQNLAVAEAMTADVMTIPANTPFGRVVDLVTDSNADNFPVITGDGKLLGILFFDDVRSALRHDALADLVIAAELVTPMSTTLHPDDNLRRAFESFEKSGWNEIPVVDPNDPSRLIGMLTRSRAMDAYNRALTTYSAAVAH